MNWNNASKGPLPEHKQQVMIAVDDLKYLAVFDKNNSLFLVSEPGGKTFVVGEEQIYWTELDCFKKKE